MCSLCCEILSAVRTSSVQRQRTLSFDSICHSVLLQVAFTVVFFCSEKSDSKNILIYKLVLYEVE